MHWGSAAIGAVAGIALYIFVLPLLTGAVSGLSKKKQ